MNHKPHYRLHCNFSDAKPLWWIGVAIGYRRGSPVAWQISYGYATSGAAVRAAVDL